MRVVITGAGGFIGRRLVERCVAADHEVTAVVSRRRPRPAVSHPEVRVVCADLAEFGSLAKAIPAADIVHHLAWSGVEPEARNDAARQLPNLDHSLDLVEAAAAMGAETIVCAGSMSEYARAGGPVTGYEDPSPIDLYSATKVAARQLMGVRCEQLGVGLVWGLLTSVYGPGRTDSNLISYAIGALLAGERPSFTGLAQVWDYVYIDDVVEALFLLGERGVAGRRYPIGSGAARPLATYVTSIRDAIDPTLPIGIGERPYKSSSPEVSIPEIGSLVRDTGYSPTVSFDVGIQSTIAYFREVGGS